MISRAIAAGTCGGLAMIPVGLGLRLGLGRAVNVYGELVVQTLLGRAYLWALVVEHVLISWALAAPLVLLAPRVRRGPFLIVGLTYGAAIWVVLNSLMLPVLFGRPTAWRIGWPAIWPSLTVHLVYGVATAAAALVVSRRRYRTHVVSGGVR